MSRSICGGRRTAFQELVFSFHRVTPGYQTRVLQAGDKYLYLLNISLARPGNVKCTYIMYILEKSVLEYFMFSNYIVNGIFKLLDFN